MAAVIQLELAGQCLPLESVLVGGTFGYTLRVCAQLLELV